jgi:hypothetical protein
MSPILPSEGDYDYGLGIEPVIIDYIKESVEIASRVSPTPCYLLFMNQSGSVVGSVGSPMTISSYSATTPNYRAVIWASGSSHPDVRPYSNNGQGSIFVTIDSSAATRVIEVADLANDNEFAVVKRKDLNPARVELVFNPGFDAGSHTIRYYYTTMQSGIDVDRVKSGEDTSISKFGWTQYLDTSACAQPFREKHQILLRLPLTTRDLSINEEGKVILEENDSWMVATPYVHDFDVVVIPSSATASGQEERYEIVNKKDSFIQGSLITQRFKLKYLERTDPRYNITIVTS